MRYQDLTPIVISDADVAAIKMHKEELILMVQRSNIVIIKTKGTNPLFRGFCIKYPASTMTDAKNGAIAIKIIIGPHQIRLYQGWLLKSIQDVLLEDIGNAYAGDIKILPAQQTDTGTPYIWRIRAGTKEHLIWRTDDRISDIRHACDAGQRTIKAYVEAGFKMWNESTTLPNGNRQINGIVVTHNAFTGAYRIIKDEESVITHNLIELFYTLYSFNLSKTEGRQYQNHWADSIAKSAMSH